MTKYVQGAVAVGTLVRSFGGRARKPCLDLSGKGQPRGVQLLQIKSPAVDGFLVLRNVFMTSYDKCCLSGGTPKLLEKKKNTAL